MAIVTASPTVDRASTTPGRPVPACAVRTASPFSVMAIAPAPPALTPMALPDPLIVPPRAMSTVIRPDACALVETRMPKPLSPPELVR